MFTLAQPLDLGPDKASIYANAANLGAIALVMLTAAVVVIMLPRRTRILVGAALSAAWLPMNLFTEIPALFVPAKVSFLAGPVVILVGLYSAAPWSLKRGVCFALPLWGLLAAVFVIRTEDFDYALAVRIGWSFGAFAFACLAVYMVETRQYREVLGAFFVGAMIPVIFAASAYVLSPGAGFGRGVGRFFPWGANPNQIGPLFASASVLGLTLVLTERKKMRQQLLVAAVVFCMVLTLMTGSRSALLVVVFPCLILAMGYRKFVWVVGICVIGGLAVGIIVYQDETVVDLGRIASSDDSGRVLIAVEYINRLLVSRPTLGLLEESGLNSQREAGVGTHSHNIYVEFLYIGGLPFTLLTLCMFAWGATSSVRVIRHGFRLRDPVLLTLGSLPIAMMVHGLTTIVLLYPTNVWYMVAVVTSIASVHICQMLQNASAAGPMPAAQPPSVRA